MRKRGFIPFLIYLPTALVCAFFIFNSMMWAVWGAPIHPAHYVALPSALLLAIAAVTSLDNAHRGRALALISLVGIGVLWIPSVKVLVPAYSFHISPTAYFVFGVYFVILGFALYYPTRWRLSPWLLMGAVIIAVAFGVGEYVNRVRSGEYDRPSFVFLRWDVADSGGITLTRDPFGSMSLRDLRAIEAHGLNGRLECVGGGGNFDNENNRVIVLCASNIPRPKSIPYPQEGLVVYAFDGTRWVSYPDTYESYRSHATLEPFGDSMMLEVTVAGGARQSTLAIVW